MAELDDSPEPLRPALTPEAKADMRRHAELWRERSEKLVRRIVTDTAKLNGAAHIRGTTFTVSDIRAAWGERGVRIEDMYLRFRGLTPDDLEAALIHYKVSSEPVAEDWNHYVAEWAGPPRRKLYLWCDDPSKLGPGVQKGWHFVVNEFDDDGAELTAFDTWEETFTAISRYPDAYAPRDIVWRDGTSNVIVDFCSLNLE